MDNGGLSASDVALLSKDGDFGLNGGGAMMWIFALLILANGGLGFGGNNFANAIGYENLATSNEVQRGFDNQNLQAQTRDILAAVTAGTAQSVATTNQVYHDIVGTLGDKYNEITRDIADMRVAQTQLLANQNECCGNTMRAIENINYQNAVNTAAINANIVEQIQGVKDLISGNRMADMQNQINDLQLQNALSGVVRYPNGWTYNAGTSPFCNCNPCGCQF